MASISERRFERKPEPPASYAVSDGRHVCGYVEHLGSCFTAFTCDGEIVGEFGDLKTARALPQTGVLS